MNVSSYFSSHPHCSLYYHWYDAEGLMKSGLETGIHRRRVIFLKDRYETSGIHDRLEWEFLGR